MMNFSMQYSDYVQPSFAPPSEVFAPVWTILYTLIIISFGFVFYKTYNKEIPFFVVIPFILNLFFNFLFTYLQFGLGDMLLASIDIVLVLGTLIWSMVAVWKYYKWVSLINIPYLLWVSFATVLQLSIYYLNSGVMV